MASFSHLTSTCLDFSNVTDLYAFQFDLGYDSTLLFATGITEGPFLPNGGATFYLPGSIDNSNGTISFTADTLLGPVSGVTGTGVLATATFQAIGLGSAQVSIFNNADFLLLDSTGASIGATLGAGTVNVALTLEPRLVSLLLGAVFLIGVAGWRVMRVHTGSGSRRPAR